MINIIFTLIPLEILDKILNPLLVRGFLFNVYLSLYENRGNQKSI
jgi:hypothetical protein